MLFEKLKSLSYLTNSLYFMSSKSFFITVLQSHHHRILFSSPSILSISHSLLFLVSTIIYFIYLFTAIGLLPGDSGYFTYKQNMKLVTTRFKSGGLHEKHVVATWNRGNHLSICL